MTETKASMRQRKGLLIAELTVVLILIAVVAGYFTLRSTGIATYIIHDGDQTTMFRSDSSDIDEVLAETGITVGEHDLIHASANGSTTEITIERQNNVTVSMGNETFETATYGDTVEQLLGEMDISLSEQDTMISEGESLSLGDKLYDGMDISITRNSEETVTKTISIPYEQVTFLDPSLEKGSKTIKTPGVNGQQEITSLEKYVNGTLVSSTVLSTKLLSNPVTEVILIGSGEQTGRETEAAVSIAPMVPESDTSEAQSAEDAATSDTDPETPEETPEPTYEDTPVYEPEAPVYEEPVYEEPAYEEPAYEEPAYEEPAYEEPEYEEPTYEEPAYEEPAYEEPEYEAPSGNYITTSSGETLYYSSSFTVEATAYTGGGTTATGTPARYGAIAVDPSVIPYGTRMYIVTSDGSWVYGVATAEDCGGAINGYIVDLYFDDYSTCIQFGRRNCTVYILD